MNDEASFLASVKACEGMTGLELHAFAAFLEPRQLAKDEVLFSEGEAGSEMYILRSGRIGTYVVEPDGSKREVYEFAAGHLFGEMAIAEGSVRSATAWAKEDSLLLALGAVDFYRLVWEHPGLGVKLLGNMARHLASWLDEAAGYLGDLARWGEDARRRALVDEATGLFNRSFLEESMRARIGRGIDGKRPCSLVALDIDRFRAINEAHGPKAGDAVIAQTGACIGRVVDDARIEGAVVARLAGDEFSIFIPDGGLPEAKALGERIRVALEELFMEFRTGGSAEPCRVSVTTSVGCASAPFQASTMEALIEAADKALFRAKEEGRNRVACYDD